MATDLAGNFGDFSKHFPVEKLDHEQTLLHHRPDIVICSWMSMKVDLTSAFRASRSLTEYILIGEVDYGVSGTARETWGLQDPEPLYSREGFQRITLEKLSLLQLARSDSPYVRFHSQTTVFRRVPTARDKHTEL